MSFPPGNRVEEYKLYHYAMLDAGDCDPAYGMLRYVAERFELNLEQRYWLAWLYATCYSAATAFYMYNEFPDFENAEPRRMERWWRKNRSQLIFQTDRRWVRSSNMFVDMFVDYRKWVASAGRTQDERFGTFAAKEPRMAYARAYSGANQLYGFGRFSLFLYLEAVFVLTGFRMEPDGMDLREAQSSCNGLCFALGRDDLLRGSAYGRKTLPKAAYGPLEAQLWDLVATFRRERPDLRADIWNVETTLCAYKKFKLGKRYIGYYLERERKEIATLQERVAGGVCWDVLWDYRAERAGA